MDFWMNIICLAILPPARLIGKIYPHAMTEKLVAALLFALMGFASSLQADLVLITPQLT